MRNLLNLKRCTTVCRFLLVLCLTAMLSACAAQPKLVDHAFTYNGHFDKWAEQVDLLEYSYGDQYHMVRDKVHPGDERVSRSTIVNGAMPVGEFLYVKWRIKETGEVIEDKVDLRTRLPTNMFGHKLTFVIDGKQLYVYLVTPKAKAKGSQDLKTYLSYSYITYEIYPTNTYKP